MFFPFQVKDQHLGLFVGLDWSVEKNDILNLTVNQLVPDGNDAVEPNKFVWHFVFDILVVANILATDVAWLATRV